MEQDNYKEEVCERCKKLDRPYKVKQRLMGDFECVVCGLIWNKIVIPEKVDNYKELREK